MQYTLIIPGRLSSMNDYIDACRSGKQVGNRLKQEEQEDCEYCIMQQLKNVKIEDPVRLYFTWYEKERRRDLDNISSFGRKVIQDALVKQEVIPNDGWKNVVGFTDDFYIDKNNPRIEVIVEVVT